MKYFGIAVQADGSVLVSKARANEEAAVKLAEQKAGTSYFAVQAANAAEARRAAEAQLAEERAEAEKLTEQGDALVEPTEAELAEAKSAESALSEVGRAVAEDTLPWYGAALREELTEVDGERTTRLVAMVSPVGHRSLMEARSEADALDEAVDGSQFVVQADSAEQALEVATQFAAQGMTPNEPVYATPRQPAKTRRTPAQPGERRPSLLGTFTPLLADVYYVTKPGTVHIDPTCRFVAGKAEVETYEAPGEPVVAEVKDNLLHLTEEPHPVRKTASGRKLVSWCVYCAEDRTTPYGPQLRLAQADAEQEPTGEPEGESESEPEGEPEGQPEEQVEALSA